MSSWWLEIYLNQKYCTNNMNWEALLTPCRLGGRCRCVFDFPRRSEISGSSSPKNFRQHSRQPEECSVAYFRRQHKLYGAWYASVPSRHLHHEAYHNNVSYYILQMWLKIPLPFMHFMTSSARFTIQASSTFSFNWWHSRSGIINVATSWLDIIWTKISR